MSDIKKNGKWIYIAAPYTHPDPVENTHRAIKAGEMWIAKGYIPVIPHLSLLWHMVVPHPEQFWYDVTLEWMKRCDCVFRLSGKSTGADEEVRVARELGLTIFFEESADA